MSIKDQHRERTGNGGEAAKSAPSLLDVGGKQKDVQGGGGGGSGNETNEIYKELTNTSKILCWQLECLHNGGHARHHRSQRPRNDII